MFSAAYCKTTNLRVILRFSGGKTPPVTRKSAPHLRQRVIANRAILENEIPPDMRLELVVFAQKSTWLFMQNIETQKMSKNSVTKLRNWGYI